MSQNKTVSNPLGKNIAVLSGKGGTGKTAIAISLAAALQGLGENTLLVDANLEHPHIGVSLGSGHHPHYLHDVLADRAAHTQAITYHPSGLKVVPGDPHPKNLALKHERLAKYNHAADVVLYDGPPHDHEHVLRTADQVLIIAKPQYPSLLAAHRLLKEVHDQRKVLVGLVINNPGKHDLRAEEVERFLDVPVIATIPRDERFDKALASRTPYYHAHQGRPAARAIKELAARIVAKPL